MDKDGWHLPVGPEDLALTDGSDDLREPSVEAKTAVDEEWTKRDGEDEDPRVETIGGGGAEVFGLAVVWMEGVKVEVSYTVFRVVSGIVVGFVKGLPRVVEGKTVVKAVVLWSVGFKEVVWIWGKMVVVFTVSSASGRKQENINRH